MIDPEYKEYTYYISKWSDDCYTASTFDELGEEYAVDDDTEAKVIKGIKLVIDKLIEEEE